MSTQADRGAPLVIRVTVPRQAAEALMPLPCPHVDCEGEGDVHCWGCHGSGVLPPVLRLLVVESYWPPGFVTDDDHPPTPNLDIAKVIEAGERIGIDAACGMCGGDGRYWTGIGADGYDFCPHCDGSGLVPVGSVRPVRVLPIIDEDQWKAAPGAPDAYTVSPGKPDVVFDPLLRKVDPLSVYGPAESLVGKSAVVCEDARREP